jgi:hypothetical protein
MTSMNHKILWSFKTFCHVCVRKHRGWRHPFLGLVRGDEIASRSGSDTWRHFFFTLGRSENKSPTMSDRCSKWWAERTVLAEVDNSGLQDSWLCQRLIGLLLGEIPFSQWPGASRPKKGYLSRFAYRVKGCQSCLWQDERSPPLAQSYA